MASEQVMAAEVTVIGAGAAGLYTALTAARAGARSTLISATPLADTASYWAQGGLAAALAEDDTPALHLEDTVRAGRGAVRLSAATVLCTKAPERVRDLERLGVRFDADRFGHLALGLEGGHSRRRVVHAGGSATGRRVVRQLSALVAEHPGVEVLERARAQSLVLRDGRCVGVACEDGRRVSARAVVVCAGGAAALWSRTTNPPGSVGTGMLLAAAAGAALADLELVQFHPTAVIGVRGREGFLVTEAVRGEGATLQDDAGERFVDELAPRDEVARAIADRMAATGAGSVWLDMRHIDPALFPNVVTALRDAGLDPVRERIPVAPAAHYVMGGIVTDLHGATAVPGLYAAGESACTGLHGANRLASNSLSECFVFGHRAAEAGLAEPALAGSERDLLAAPLEPPAALPMPSADTRRAMWRWAGLQRNGDDLARLLGDEHPLARAVAACALARRETRGAHIRTDCPELDPELEQRHAVIAAPGSEPRFERWS